MAESFTPLRYPGGKSKLFPLIVDILKSNSLDGVEYCEPYAGGAGVAIELLAKGFASKIHINDKSYPVYCFWKSLISDSDSFNRILSGAPLNVEEWRKQKAIIDNQESHSELDIGFAFFYLNRTNRSGILTGGPIGGYQQNGNYKIDARFNKQELIKKISRIANFEHNICVYNLDAIDLIRNVISKLSKRSFIYLDPPYFEQGKRLYLNYYNKNDHADVAAAIQKHIKNPWIVTYDFHPEIIDLYQSKRQYMISLNYSATNHRVGHELLVVSDALKLPDSPMIHEKNSEFMFIQ